MDICVFHLCIYVYEKSRKRASIIVRFVCICVCERQKQSAIIAVQGVDSTGMCSNMPSN